LEVLGLKTSLNQPPKARTNMKKHVQTPKIIKTTPATKHFQTCFWWISMLKVHVEV
jgi:hypothetical protein